MDRPGLLRDTKGGSRQEEVETAGCKVIGDATTTLRVTGLMMMVMKGRTGWTEEEEEQRVMFCCERKDRVDRGGRGAACYVLL